MNTFEYRSKGTVDIIGEIEDPVKKSGLNNLAKSFKLQENTEAFKKAVKADILSNNEKKWNVDEIITNTEPLPEGAVLEEITPLDRAVNRITSYNVCYTKLLRMKASTMGSKILCAS